MKFIIFINLLLTILLSSSVFCISREKYDFFYLIQQWPVSVCKTKEGCCPSGGKPAANFTIEYFQPAKADEVAWGCTGSQFDSSKISDLTGILHSKWPSLLCPGSDDSNTWAQQWKEHGVCSESVLDQHAYFQSAIDLSHNVDLVTALNITGTTPDTRLHTPLELRQIIKDRTGKWGWIECNLDSEGNKQLYRVYLCADRFGKSFIDCPWSMPLIYDVCHYNDLVRIPSAF